MTTRIVNLLGAELAGELIPAGVGNERGHWESRAVQALHNRILAELDSHIYSPLNIPPDWFGSAAARQWTGRMRDLLADEYALSRFFVLKDPRMALFLPLWLEAMRESSIVPRFVLPFRSPDAVARSLEARERRLGSGHSLPHAQGVAVWLRYVLAAERSTRGQLRSFVAFEDVLVDWRTQFARVGRQLGIDWPDWRHAGERIDGFLDGGAGSGETRGRAHEVAGICRDVYAGLQRAVLEPDSAAPAFDAAAQSLATAESLLGPYVAARERDSGDARKRAEDDLRRHDAERAQMHRRFETELDLRAARLAEAAAHAQRMEEGLTRAAAHVETLERDRSTAIDYARSLERDRDDAAASADALRRSHDEAVARIEALQRECSSTAGYARSLELDRERAAEYAGSLQRSRDEALRYARSLERARDGTAQEEAPARTGRSEGCVFFTIASRNYLAYALTLMQSVAEHYPDAPRYLILADRDEGDPTLADAPFATVPADALALPDFDAFAFRYTIMEFNTAIKPYAFSHLRRLHPGAGIVYLDPDVLVLEPLAKVEAALAEGALAVLTPHLLQPVDDDRQPGEREILASGTYNCGFIAIGAHVAAERLIAWWAARLEFGAVSDVAAGLFTDQKWIDLVPGLFPDVHILRDEGYNLAYWNLSQRPVARRGDRWHAAGRPLVFAHFSGVDPDCPARFSRHQNRHTQATIGPLRPLYEHYLARLAANGHDTHRLKPYAFGRFADGEPICEPVRAVYRRYFDKGTTQPQGHPFSMDRSLYDLPCDELPVRADAPITRVMYAAWRMRADVRRVFDIGGAEGRDGFIRWFVRAAGIEMGVPGRHLDPVHRALAEARTGGAQEKWRPAPGLVRRAGSACLGAIDWSCRFRFALRVYAMIPEPTRNRIRRRLERIAFAGKAAAPVSAPVRADPPPGINLVGYAHGEFGVAEILRRHACTLRQGGVPFVVRNFDVGVASRQLDRSMQDFLSEECRHDVNLFCINADQMPVARQHLGAAAFAGRYNIGCWFWELEKFPERWREAIDLVDEIWVTSPFVRDAIAACTSKPVHIVPVALGTDAPGNRPRSEFDLAEDAFVCLFSFDFNSFATRKNAEGAIAAFRRAFAGERRDVRLLVKTINGERFPDALRGLVDAAAGDDRIEVRDGFLDRSGMRALQACCDCYVSLHRSEGLGLGMAECMLLGKPVVATAYSGNLAFMDADNSCLVGYTLVPVKEGEYPAWQGQHWADPDVDQAAAYLRRLADDPVYARRIGANARASVRQRLSTSASLAAMTARLADIRSRQPGEWRRAAPDRERKVGELPAVCGRGAGGA